MTIYKCDKCGREVDRTINESVEYEVMKQPHTKFELCNECDRDLKDWLKVLPPKAPTAEEMAKDRVGSSS